uniref:Potassium channel domain-containing protein n=1 Tax=Panagrolaimus sp. JU765 TaxID=591449 RepID=A0AC34QH25_9BILA
MEEEATVTWPRSQLPPKVKPEFQKRVQLQAAIGNLRQHARQMDDENVGELVDKLREMCSNIEEPRLNQSENYNKNLAGSKKSFYGSMILRSSPPPSIHSSVQVVNGKLKEVMIPDEKMPIWVKLLTVTVIIFVLFLFLVFGTVSFQILEPTFKNHTFSQVFMLPLQTCLTIGWGNLPLTAPMAQLFCIFYAILGVPLTFTTLTRIGQFWFPYYIPDWLLNSASIHHVVGEQDEIVKFPFFGALKFILTFHIIGLILFNGFLDNFGIVETVYFDYFTSAFIGFGDISPNPKIIWQSLVLFFYLPFGGIFQAVYHAFAGYWVQRLYYVIFRNYLYNWHIARQQKKEIVN